MALWEPFVFPLWFVPIHNVFFKCPKATTKDRASVVFHQPFGVPGASRGLPDLLLQRAHPLCELRQGEGSHDHRQSPLWPHLHRGGWASSGSRGVSQGREERRGDFAEEYTYLWLVGKGRMIVMVLIIVPIPPFTTNQR